MNDVTAKPLLGVLRDRITELRRDEAMRLAASGVLQQRIEELEERVSTQEGQLEAARKFVRFEIGRAELAAALGE